MTTEIDAEGLALCPFCGGAPRIVGYGPYHIECPACGVRGPSCYDMMPNNAIAAMGSTKT